MSTTEKKRELEHRARLLEALACSLRERGLRATQIADIVRLAHTSRRTFYECFADKETCFVELVREATTRLLATIEASIDPAAPWEAQVDRAVDTYVQALAEDPAMIATISRELPALGLRGAAVQREGIERYAALVVRLAASGRMVQAGVRKLPLQAAVMLVGGINELVIHAVEHGESLDTVAAVAKDVIKAVLRPA
ncbi:MAG TPA: TetR/AcrR family transcriptional regulator [Solirubrobacteraceae bacterium]|nr:TetR/AcrR family transcriptional regulator [Solirubrobacteraceae bacterium]